MDGNEAMVHMAMALLLGACLGLDEEPEAATDSVDDQPPPRCEAPSDEPAPARE